MTRSITEIEKFLRISFLFFHQHKKIILNVQDLFDFRKSQVKNYNILTVMFLISLFDTSLVPLPKKLILY